MSLLRSITRVGLLLAAALGASVAGAQPPYQGRPVVELLEDMRAQGVPLVYSSDLVSEDLLVVSEPSGTSSVEVLRDALAPHGLALVSEGAVYLIERAGPGPSAGAIEVRVTRLSASPTSRISVRLDGPERRVAELDAGAVEFAELPAGEYTVTAEALLHAPARRTVVLEPAQTARVTLQLQPDVPRLEEVTVSASRYDIRRDGPYTAAYFSRAEVENLSDLGGDPLRIVHRLPGAASGGFSAKSHMRGGGADEMAIVLDGLELIDPFHIRDFESLFSTINQRAISSIEVYSGGFPVDHGNSLSGLMLIEPRAPEGERLHELGVSLFSTSLLSSGKFRDDHADWLVALRRGNLDLLLDRAFGRPSYNDAYAHLGFELGDKTHLTVNGLASEDDILLIAEDDGINQENARSDTSNQQFWLKIENQWSDALSSETVVSSAHFSNTRSGIVVDPAELDAQVRDRRVLDLSAVKQDWQYASSDRQLLKWGFDARRLDAGYDYTSARTLYGFFAAFPGVPRVVQRDVQIAPQGELYALYFSDRLSIGERVVAELGARWDKQTYLRASVADDQISPRLSLLYRFGPRTDLRASWGRFYQSQDILTLQVEDGLQSFFPAQLAEHSILSFEHLFANDVALRVEAYRKSMPELAPRFENLFETMGLLLEVRPDRTLIDPGRGTALGVELLVSKDNPSGLNWWASYTRSHVEDTVDGRDVARSWDQRHAVSGGFTWQGAHWTVTPALSYHTGWPTTALRLDRLPPVNGEPRYEVVAGERNAERLGGFRRLDARAARYFDLTRGSLEVFAEATNLLDRKNPCCVDYRVELDESGAPRLEKSIDHWLARVISVGFLWEF